ncbi:TetR family transcriptional regulator C-terminal domain-containing protein [Agilicoccus flavus]|uniref:TetR family transcriptional regulator C-terminal domain-containing protein n=1 Tax=Agilicoccus flavus TaxID=2775968 RepID=UPI001CF6556F|nr:TetR family transcriptional regulator C-terminal domain-containing protein [Agilicoccus flavus]
MPRQVDHAQRRSEISHAVWAVVARNGLDAVSLRTVAAEAGISAGRVQHYFATKDEMVLEAAREMARAAELAARGRTGHGLGADGHVGRQDPGERGIEPLPGADADAGRRRDVAGAGRGDRAASEGVRAAVRRVLTVGIPCDDGSRLGASVWFAFVAKAAVWPELARVVAGEVAGGRDWLRVALADARAAGELTANDVDADAEAEALAALADGLVGRVLVGAITPERAFALLDARLDALFGPGAPGGVA